ncbi:hypothetical protein Tco_0186813 [Tanacetum coccineum]
MSLNSTLIASRLLTRPGALLVVSSVGIGGTPSITGQMANSVTHLWHLGAHGPSWPGQCSASCSVVVVVVVVGSECSLRCPQTSFYSLSGVQQKVRIFLSISSVAISTASCIIFGLDTTTLS